MHNRRFGPHGEWLERDGSVVTVGLTTEMVDHIGEVAFVELPKVATPVHVGQVAVVVESSKAAIDCESPLSGTVVEVNNQLHSLPALLNSDPEATGWLYRIDGVREEEWQTMMVKPV